MNEVKSYLVCDENFTSIDVVLKMFKLITKNEVSAKKGDKYYELSPIDRKDFNKLTVSIITIRNDLSLQKLALVVVPFYDIEIEKLINTNDSGVVFLYDIVFNRYNKREINLFFFKDLFSKLNSELLLTIKTYIELDGGVEDVSEVLFTHRNTINYRINKFNQITQIDIRNKENMCLVRYLFLLLNLGGMNYGV